MSEMVGRKDRGEGIKQITRELGVDRKTVASAKRKSPCNRSSAVALADRLECFGPLADNDVARAMAKSRSEEGAQALSDKFLKISELGELHP